MECLNKKYSKRKYENDRIKNLKIIIFYILF